MKSKHYLHGGDLDGISRQYGINKEDIWDFSGNINPLGISPSAKEALIKNIDCITTYPDAAYIHLKETVAAYCSVDPSHVLVGNGSTEIISLFIQNYNPKNTLIIGPTYSEYERELSLLNSKITYYRLQEENAFLLSPDDLIQHIKEHGYDLVILCNPNNPTSTAVTNKDLKYLLSSLKQIHSFLMVDETYIEFCEDVRSFSCSSLVDSFDNLIVIRGISKFFSSPGLRFGYGLSSSKKVHLAFSEHKKPWSINSLAVIGAAAMLNDKEYINKTHEFFSQERKRIIGLLSDIKSIKVYKPEANFVLLKLNDSSLTASMITEKLIQKKMLIRDCSSFPFLNDQFIRFCFLLPSQNTALINTLKDLL